MKILKKILNIFFNPYDLPETWETFVSFSFFEGSPANVVFSVPVVLLVQTLPGFLSCTRVRKRVAVPGARTIWKRTECVPDRRAAPVPL